MNPTTPIRSGSKARLLLCVMLLTVACSGARKDDDKSMQLVVNMLSKVDNPATLKSLMQGMLRGLGGSPRRAASEELECSGREA